MWVLIFGWETWVLILIIIPRSSTAVGCAGVTFDWKIKNIQTKYFAYFSPYLKAKIEKMD